jgi:hypothetical protein
MTKIQKMYQILCFYRDYYGWTSKDFQSYPSNLFFQYTWDHLKEGGDLEINLNKLIK